MPSTLGIPTQSLWEKVHRGLFHAFTVAAAVSAGMMVKLDSTGKLVPAVAGDTQDTIIGTCIHKKAIGEDATVAMKAQAIIISLSGAAVVPGPVEYAGFDATTGLPKYATTTAVTKTQGWALQAVSGTGIQFLVAIL